MILRDTIKKTEESQAYKEWKKKNPDYYLAHAFTMLDEKEKRYRWELGYYSPTKDKLTVIETEPEIRAKAEEDVFKKDGTVQALDMKKVKISVTRAMEICDELLKEKYKNQMVSKRIILLQKATAQMYNITLVTHTFSILNIRIDAGSGEVISHNLQSIMNLGSWERGGGGKKEPAGSTPSTPTDERTPD
ncbi:hypothetical protein JW826_01250 [Candidatus Woesearchaeota archaeon]|nr:hypothetical protein [Candidatus Woesearchaeota archaeon]